MTNNLIIKNAYTHNLKHIDLTLPQNSVNLIIGKSGSGKSSLAFNTIHSESQSKYIETFSSYTRQFFTNVQKGNVESIKNIRPSIAIMQRTKIRNSRSTVGSLCHLDDYLRIFFTNFASCFCPKCGKELTFYPPHILCKKLLTDFKEDKNSQKDKSSYFLMISDIKFKNEKEKLKTLQKLKILGYSKIFDEKKNKVLKLQDLKSKDIKENLLLIVDRLSSFSKEKEERIAESIKTCYKLSSGICRIFKLENEKIKLNLRFSQDPTCPDCEDVKLPRLMPSIFSHNHPLGACPECNGFGKVLTIDYDLAVPNQNLSINEGAVNLFETPTTQILKELLFKYCDKEKINRNIPFYKLPKKDKDKIYYNETNKFCGIKPYFDYLERKKYKMHIRVFLSRYKKETPCPVCNGTRIRGEALSYKINGLDFFAFQDLEIGKLKTFINDFLKDKKIESIEQKEIIKQINERLDVLIKLGLSYLTPTRQAKTLSGGETQRVNIVTALGAPLSNTHFILDEPSCGLHKSDTENLIKVLYELKSKNNTVTVLEHDPKIICAAENLTELGKGAGSLGGEIVYSGTPKNWDYHEFENALNLDVRKKIKPKDFITIKNASFRNLKNIDVNIGLNCINALCGVSGSGKTTLAKDVLFESFQNLKNKKKEQGCEKILGLNKIKDVIFVDQSSIMKSPRSNIASFSKIWDEIRDIFANEESAKERNIKKSDFSFNVDGGRCPTCKGMGYLKEDMQFLDDVYIPCETCLGKRFKEKVLEVTYKGKNIDDILNMTLKDAKEFFSDNKKISDVVTSLNTLSLSYLKLGHPLSELSGGEAQRLKLAPFISLGAEERSKENYLFIFDEPSTGLYPTDINNLILLFDLIIKNGHTILLIEHNEQILKSADYIIELGKSGGEKGGYLVRNCENKATPAPFDFKKECKKCEGSKLKKDEIIIKNAYEHNLKNINLNIGLQKTISLVGVSGSGKSTIAKNIIFSEGQRNFIDCLSPYARFFIKGLKKPKVDYIDNIPPVIFLGQQVSPPSSISTLGTVSECYNFLRLLFAKTGTQYCEKHPQHKIGKLSTEDFIEKIKEYKNKRIKILAPIINQKKGTHTKVFQRAIDLEISKVRVNDEWGTPGKFLDTLERYKTYSIDYVIGEFIPENLSPDILNDLVSLGLKLGDGKLIIIDEKNKENILNKDMACPICGSSSLKLDPEDFSFNSKRGACPRCKGKGVEKNGSVCKKCEGSRLKKERLLTKVHGKNIFELSCLTSKELLSFLKDLNFEDNKKEVSKVVLKELFQRLEVLIKIGLGDISLNRNASDISRGEYQRLRLSSCIGSFLTNTLYIFDEPSIGLCKEDNEKVLEIFDTLKKQGNTLLVIEHDKDTILHSDNIIEIGPEGGKNGGKVIANESLDKFLKTSNSITCKYLKRKTTKKDKKEYLKNSSSDNYIHINTGEFRNIKNQSCKFLFNAINVVTGVSGAGKSTLLNDITSNLLIDALKNKLEPKKSFSKNGHSIKLDKKFDNVLLIDQKPIAKNVRSTPASFLGIFDEIRKILASTNDAKIRGFDASYFSYNAGKGKCHYCKGSGVQKLEMSFMPEATIECPICEGKRFNEETLNVKYLGFSAYDFLNLTFDEVKDILKNHKKIYNMCFFASKIGIGYLRLGQVSGTLSGGEAQRLKLVKELAQPKRGHTIYILDEPSIGLHPADVEKLNSCFNDLVSKDNTILLIEHDEDIINNADYIIRMGPKSGMDGGKVVLEKKNF